MMNATMIYLLCSRNVCPQFLIGRHWRVALFVITLLLVSACGNLNADEQAIWRTLKSGNHFAILRHAIAPGTGDPVNFKLGKCATQRNHSHTGRKQAVTIGERFRANGYDKARVLSSQWCRCLETAKLLSLGPVEPFAALNSFTKA